MRMYLMDMEWESITKEIFIKGSGLREHMKEKEG